MEALKGKRTYILAAAVAVVTVVQYLGFIDGTTAATLYGLLGAGGMATMRAGMKA